MQTIYVDVYFLINFTVDLLALYSASLLSKIKTGVTRLILGGIFGGLYAVFAVLFFESNKILPILSAASIVIMVYIVAYRVSFYRKIRFALAFLLFQILIGGIVYAMYIFLDGLVAGSGIGEGGAENRKILIFAIFILITIGIVRLVILFFSEIKAEKKARIKINVNNASEEIDALVDSGNLLCDPFDRTPVMLINYKTAKKLLGLNEPFEDCILKDTAYRGRVRVIPASFGGNKTILYAIKPDGVYIIKDKNQNKINLLIAIDKETKSYGGYPALIPLAALLEI